MTPQPQPQSKPNAYLRLSKLIGYLTIVFIIAVIIYHFYSGSPFLGSNSWLFYASFAAAILSIVLFFIIPRKPGAAAPLAIIQTLLFLLSIGGWFDNQPPGLTITPAIRARIIPDINIIMSDTSKSVGGRTKYAILYCFGEKTPDTTKVKSTTKMADYGFDDAAYYMLTQYLNCAVQAGNSSAKLLLPSAVKTASKIQDCITLVNQAIKPVPLKIIPLKKH
jgi:hypothetical protein